MELFVSIGEQNSYQKNSLATLTSSGNITLVDEVTNQTEIILATRWQDAYFHDNLKAVFIPYTGLNRFPVEALREKGVEVINTHAKAKLVAERAFALSLTVMGKVVSYHHKLKQENLWTTRYEWGQEFWYSLQNKRCGIVGMGHIGQALSTYLKPFKCQIITLDRGHLKEDGVEYVESFEELVESSEVIFFTCALNDQTHHLINMDNLELFKNKFIINVSRGEVIEEEALYKGLEHHIFLGAGIDVWYQYPDNGIGAPSKYTYDFENIVMSPHASCHAVEFKNSYYEDIFHKIEHYSKR